MKLRTFYVRSYRSIVEATLDNLQQYSVIVGPNNSGKSTYFVPYIFHYLLH